MGSDKPGKTARLASAEGCGICGNPLVYGRQPIPVRCAFCGRESKANIYCPDGHYVCDSCHQAEATGVLRQVLASSSSRSPAELAELVMTHPGVPMHGPEHHSIVPAVLVAAAKNAGYRVPEKAIETAIERGSLVPGGWCGYYGACGAAVGVGIAASVLTGSTPLTGRERSLALEATSLALSRMLDGYPRCCKRAVRRALGAAVDFLSSRLGISLEPGEPVICRYTGRNRECPRQGCEYYAAPVK